jgi:colanic acid biosynthesis glycosyl transferase WcaI
VTVLSTTPHYNFAGRVETTSGFEKRWLGLYYISYYRGIKIYHIPQKKFKNILLRIAGFVHWHLLSCVIGLSGISYDIVISPSPPLSIGLISIILGKIKKAKVIYNVQEIYPDLLINQKELNSRPIIFLLRKLEKFIYDHSDIVITIDKVFYDIIVPRFKYPSRLHIVPNFVDMDFYAPVEPFRGFIRGNEWDDNHLKIMYAGNIGHAQNWDLLLEVAEKLREFPVRFYIIGDGVQKDKLCRDAEYRKLDSIRIFPYQDRELMPGIIAYGDVHFIFMNENIASQGFPSKVYSILACAKPLLVYSTPDSPLCGLLRGLNSGFLFSPGDGENVAENIKDAVIAYLSDKELLKLHSRNARKVILSEYSKDKVIDKYIDLVKRL